MWLKHVSLKRCFEQQTRSVGKSHRDQSENTCLCADWGFLLVSGVCCSGVDVTVWTLLPESLCFSQEKQHRDENPQISSLHTYWGRSGLFISLPPTNHTFYTDDLAAGWCLERQEKNAVDRSFCDVSHDKKVKNTSAARCYVKSCTKLLSTTELWSRFQSCSGDGGTVEASGPHRNDGADGGAVVGVTTPTQGSWPGGSLQTSVAAAHSLTSPSNQSALCKNVWPAPPGPRPLLWHTHTHQHAWLWFWSVSDLRGYNRWQQLIYGCCCGFVPATHWKEKSPSEQEKQEVPLG